jgi:hypothetical protein
MTGKPNDRENLIGQNYRERTAFNKRKKSEEKLILPSEKYVRNLFNNRPRNGFELEKITN